MPFPRPPGNHEPSSRARRGPRGAWPTRLAALALVGGCAAPAPRGPAPAASAPTPARFLDPRLAADPDGALYLAAIERTAHGPRVFLAVSPDHGESWQVCAPRADSQPGVRRRPQLALGASGDCCVLWEDERAGTPGIWFNATRDGGRTWLAEDRRLDPGGANAHPAAPALACDDRGTVYAAWLDVRDGFDALYVNVSRDHGTSWQASDRRVGNLSVGRRSRLRLACDDSGGVYAVWIEESGGVRRVTANSSSDHGTTWLFDDVGLDAGWGAAGAELVVTEDRVAVAAWLEEDAAAARIEAARSVDAGRTWQRAPFADPTAQAFSQASLPRLACGAALQTYLAWHTVSADGRARITLQASPDAGATAHQIVLERPSPIGPAAFAPERRWLASPFGMAVDRAGNLYLAWVEGAVGAPRVGFDRLTSFGRVWTRVPTGPESYGHEPQDAGAPLVAADDFGHVCVVWNEGSRLHVAASPFYGEAGWRHTDLEARWAEKGEPPAPGARGF